MRDRFAPRQEQPLPRARKRLGQHFLTDRRILGRIVDALALTGDETVIEVGPGRGSLTDLIAERAGRLVAIEIDRVLVPYLRARYATNPRVEIVHADVLQTDLATLAGGGEWSLAGNVPYYITTPILFQALRAPRPRVAVYLVQREVAERIAAGPGSKVYGALSVNVQAVAVPEILFHVPAGAFHPPPAVESSVLRLSPRPDPVVSAEEEDVFRGFVQEAFGLRRKQLRRVVRTIRALDATRAEAALAVAELDPDARPEVLDAAAFARLVRALRLTHEDASRGRQPK